MSLARQASSKSSLDLGLPAAQSDETIQSIHDAQSLRFDMVIGEIENILLDPEFIKMQDGFFDAHCHEFENKDENKLICMDIFQRYVRLVESYLDSRLRAVFAWFSMAEFMQQCRVFVRSDEGAAGGDVFDVLASLGDFAAFKEIILAYRNGREGTAPDFSDLLHTSRVG
ncbi:hypothetical protein H9P43_008386 [Blastocladiella emersonii ATCC 22665]|nr:hypothetical protein H9P43_008386 [Blastocladiella emersonii ATCC 22665]